MSVAPSGTGAAASATDDDMDVVVFDVTSGDFDFKALYAEFAALTRLFNTTSKDPFISVADDYAGTYGVAEVTALSTISVSAAASNDTVSVTLSDDSDEILAMEAVAQLINKHPHSDGIIVVADDVNSVYAHSTMTAVGAAG